MNLPDANASRWGVGLTAKKMSECRWVRLESCRAMRLWDGPKGNTFDMRSSPRCARTRMLRHL